MAQGYLKLGEILIKEGLITQEQVNEAIEVKKTDGGRIGEVLVKLGMIKEKDLVEAIGKQLSLPYATRNSGILTPAQDQGLDGLISKDFAQKNLVLPLSRNLNSLTCAVFDPLDLMLVDNLKRMTSCEINLIVATKVDIIKAIDEFYTSMLEDAVKESHLVEVTLGETEKSDTEELSLVKLIEKAEEAPVVKLIDLIIRQAIDEKASDIHIEAFKDKICLRYRIDGALCEIPPPAKHLHMAIVSRIKILSKLDIAEKRLPQDGAFTVKLEDRVVDLRVSTVPTISGEKVVMRILDKGVIPLDLSKLGYDSKQLQDIKKAVHSPYGLVFVTGPTGSGKTTTLYSILNEVKDPTLNLSTIEDPAEYKLEGINQVQIKPAIGLTFASALRSFLRQDPDVIMVGEVRDLETASICVQAALTGHLVVSTLHTNDAASAVTRLLDIGVEPFLITPSLLAIIGQRLGRKLCNKCKQPYEPKPEEVGGIKFTKGPIYKPKGCSECNQTGYRGRIAISEVLVVDDGIRALIAQRAPYVKVLEAAKASGMKSLFDVGMKKVEEGITSLEEVYSITLGLGAD